LKAAKHGSVAGWARLLEQQGKEQKRSEKWTGETDLKVLKLFLPQNNNIIYLECLWSSDA